MNAAGSDDLPFALVRQSLGSISLPEDELSSLIGATSRRWQSVLRCRKELHPGQLPMPTTPVPWYRPARRLMEDDAPEFPSRYLAYAAAQYYLQDAGSLLALAAAGADSDALQGKLICDLCAAPGGKASALVEAIGDDGFVLANEPIRSRLAVLKLNLARTGSDRFAISCLDPQQLADGLGSVFDLVLVDAPCSGQVLMSRGRQTVSSWSTKQIEHSALRQRRILEAATRLLRPGGQLIYSTCTFAEAENEAQVSQLTSTGMVEANSVARLTKYQTHEGCYRLWPQRHECAGSFAASMTAVHGGFIGEERRPPRRSRGSKPKKRDHLEPPDLSQWLSLVDSNVHQRIIDSVVLAWPQDAPAWVESLPVAGPEVAHRTGQTWKPAHAAALRRVGRVRSLQDCELDFELACRYVRGETVSCPDDGWQVVTYGGEPLGWVKASHRKGKNHLPSSARMNCEILG